jgi:catechol 2,3-dioxygenase-like lactoylglutathione lyase family enzyme
MTGHRTRAMYHATAMVRDYDAAVARLQELVGLRVLEYSAIDDPAIGRRGGMTWIGDGSLELAEPIVERAAPDRFVRRTGGGMQGLAVWVESFRATVDHVESLAAAMPVQMPAGFGFTSPRSTCGIQLEWSEFTVPEDPRAGAPVPDHTRPPALDVIQLAFVGAVVDDPVGDARRLAALMATPVTFERPDAPLGEPVAGVSVGDCSLALYRLEPATSEATWGRMHDRPRISLLAVRVPDLDEARRALDAAGAAVLRRTSASLILDPATTAGVELAVVDELLAGDPRS